MNQKRSNDPDAHCCFNDYYPEVYPAFFSGSLTFNSWQNVDELENDFLYNGKELQTDLGLDWYDYGARMYDGAGRWHAIDPLAELYVSSSTYHYAGSNPISNVDIDGRSFFSSNFLNQNGGHWSDQFTGQENDDNKEKERNNNSNNSEGASNSTLGSKSLTLEKGVEEKEDEAQNGNLIDLNKANAGQLLADYLRNFALAKDANGYLEYPYLHEFIDVNTGKPLSNSNVVKNDNRKINGAYFDVSVNFYYGGNQGFDDKYNPNTSKNQIAAGGIRYSEANGIITIYVYYGSQALRKGSSLITFSTSDVNQAYKLRAYIYGNK